MKLLIPFLLIVGLIFVSGCVKDDGKTGNYTFYTISELNSNIEPGTYQTKGFVLYQDVCPSCPFGALCAPCRYAPHIVVSEKNKVFDASGNPILSKEDLVVFTDKNIGIEIGKEYTFVVDVNPIYKFNSDYRDFVDKGYNEVELKKFSSAL